MNRRSLLKGFTTNANQYLGGRMHFGLVYILTLLIWMMLPGQKSMAAVSLVSGNGWALINTNTTGGNPAMQTTAYTINSGSNRLLVVGVEVSVNAANAVPSTKTVTWGGKTLTFLSTNPTAGNRVFAYLYYLQESDIALANGNSLVVTMGGSIIYGFVTFAAVYQGVDQTTIVRNGASLASSTTLSTSASAPATFTAGDQGIFLAGYGLNSATTTAYSSTVSGWTGSSSLFGGGTGNSGAFYGGIGTRNATTAALNGTVSMTVTVAERTSMSIVSLIPSPAATKLAYTTVPSTGTAGTPFSVTVQSQDANGNPASVTSATTITLSKGTGAGSLSGTLTGIISSGSSSVTIATPVYSAADIMTLTASATSGMTGLTAVPSGNITFSAGALDHFAISTISSPQTAGTAITGISLTAKDANNNTVTSFTGTVTYTGTAGITGTSPAFTAGQLTGVSVTPTNVGTGKTLIVTRSSKTGTATFDVVSACTAGTWLGTTSPGNWNNAANWCGGIPTSSTDVVIPSGTPYNPMVNSTTAVCATLTINVDAVLTITSSSALNVSGTLTNSAGNGGLILQSNATGTASLIHNSSNVPATVQRYITGAAEAWHFLSSPVSAQAISGTWLPSGTYGGAGGTGYDLYLWEEPKSCWKYKLNAKWDSLNGGNNNFNVGRGYLYSVQATNPTKTFSGNLNNGTQSIALKYAGSDLTVKGFNLVGNPYPSSIDWQASSGWTRTNLTTSGSGYDLWIYNPATSNYGVINSFSGTGTNSVTRYIAPMQGFFVRAASSGTLSMTNAIRVANGAYDWKSASFDPDVVSITVASEQDSGSDEARLLFGYPQNQEGAPKLFSPATTAPSLYLAEGTKNYTLRYLSDTVVNREVAVYFKPGTTGKYTLTFDFEAAQFKTVILEDRQAKIFQTLTGSPTYRFSATAADQPYRFLLHFAPIKEFQILELPAKISSDGIHILVDLTQVDQTAHVAVYDILGRKVYEHLLGSNSQHTLDFTPGKTLLVVKLNNQQGQIVRKVWCNNSSP